MRKIVPTALVQSLIGLDETQAAEKLKAAGFKSRITSVDGKGCVTTADIRSDRVEFAIEGGRVVGARIG